MFPRLTDCRATTFYITLNFLKSRFMLYSLYWILPQKSFWIQSRFLRLGKWRQISSTLSNLSYSKAVSQGPLRRRNTPVSQRSMAAFPWVFWCLGTCLLIINIYCRTSSLCQNNTGQEKPFPLLPHESFSVSSLAPWKGVLNPRSK